MYNGGAFENMDTILSCDDDLDLSTASVSGAATCGPMMGCLQNKEV